MFATILVTVLMWIGFAILGVLILCSAAFGLMFLVSKTAVDFAKHPVDCQCGPCQQRRLSEYRNTPREPDPRDIKPGKIAGWKPTTYLREGMYVVGGKDRGKTYRVRRVERSSNGTIIVHLVNISTRAQSTIPVAPDRTDKPIWLVVAKEEDR